MEKLLFSTSQVDVYVVLGLHLCFCKVNKRLKGGGGLTPELVTLYFLIQLKFRSLAYFVRTENLISMGFSEMTFFTLHIKWCTSVSLLVTHRLMSLMSTSGKLVKEENHILSGRGIFVLTHTQNLKVER